MNFNRWRNERRTDEEFMAKLGEELGEVAKAQSARLKDAEAPNPLKRGYKGHTRNLCEELEHLEFIARCWRRQVEADMAEGKLW